MIGIFSDSYGDLQAFDAAFELLHRKGAKRFFFAGGRYADLDEWFLMRRDKERGGRSYSDTDFLADVSAWLGSQEQVARPPAFYGNTPQPFLPEFDLMTIKEKFIRAPERDCLQYRDPTISRKIVDMLGDSLCCLVHDKNDLDKEDLLNATVFIHGKDPEPRVVQIGPRYFVTPGKLTGAAEQTCALLDVADKALLFSAYTLDGRTLVDGQVLSLDRRSKLSVK